MDNNNKIAVFDLDGTLWSVNSHLYMLSQIGTVNERSIVFKLFCKLFPRRMKIHLDNLLQKKIEHIDLTSLDKKICLDVEELLREKQDDGYTAIIVTNAPTVIAEYAQILFKVPVIIAPVGRKKKILDEKYKYDTLFVVTDNITDGDLIEASEQAVLIGKHLQKAYKESDKYFYWR